jgi:hypothetical protein
MGEIKSRYERGDEEKYSNPLPKKAPSLRALITEQLIIIMSSALTLYRQTYILTRLCNSF